MSQHTGDTSLDTRGTEVWNQASSFKFEQAARASAHIQTRLTRGTMAERRRRIATLLARTPAPPGTQPVPVAHLHKRRERVRVIELLRLLHELHHPGGRERTDGVRAARGEPVAVRDKARERGVGGQERAELHGLVSAGALTAVSSASSSAPPVSVALPRARASAARERLASPSSSAYTRAPGPGLPRAHISSRTRASAAHHAAPASAAIGGSTRFARSASIVASSVAGAESARPAARVDRSAGACGPRRNQGSTKSTSGSDSGGAAEAARGAPPVSIASGVTATGASRCAGRSSASAFSSSSS
jgi:hypothetical protein